MTPCRKRKYPDRESAAHVLMAMLGRVDCRGAATLNAYFCKQCRCWHVGHSKFGLTREQRSRNPL